MSSRKKPRSFLNAAQPKVPPAQLATVNNFLTIAHALVSHVVVASPATAATPQLKGNLIVLSAQVAEAARLQLAKSIRTSVLIMTGESCLVNATMVQNDKLCS